MTDRSEAAERYETALREIIALVPDYEESRRIADARGAEVANALTVGAWRAAEVARRALRMNDCDPVDAHPRRSA